MIHLLLFLIWSASALGRQCGTGPRRPLASWKFSSTSSLSTTSLDTSAISASSASYEYGSSMASGSTWIESLPLTSISETTRFLESTTGSVPRSLSSVYNSRTESLPDDDTDTISSSQDSSSLIGSVWVSRSAPLSKPTLVPSDGITEPLGDTSTSQGRTPSSGVSSGTLSRFSSLSELDPFSSSSITATSLPSTKAWSSALATDPGTNPTQTASLKESSSTTLKHTEDYTSTISTVAISLSEIITDSSSHSTGVAPTSEGTPTSPIPSTSIPQVTSEVTLSESITTVSNVDNVSDTSTPSEIKSETAPSDSTDRDETIGFSTFSSATPPQLTTSVSDASFISKTTQAVNPTGTTTAVDGVESTDLVFIPSTQTTDETAPALPSDVISSDSNGIRSTMLSTFVSEEILSTVENSVTDTDTDEVPLTRTSTDEPILTTETTNPVTITDINLTSDLRTDGISYSEFSTSAGLSITETQEPDSTWDGVVTSPPSTEETSLKSEIPDTITSVDETSTLQTSTDGVTTSEGVPEATSLPEYPTTPVDPDPPSQTTSNPIWTRTPSMTEDPEVHSMTTLLPPEITGTDIDISIPSITAIHTGEIELSITSTMTEPPAGFFPTAVSNHPEWTTNTWITTTSPGSSDPTIVPVLIGCPNCGGPGVGIVLFGFPKVIRTLFRFPDLPKFSFPCIPVLSSCSNPPITHPENDGDGEDDGDDDDHKTSKIESSTTGASTCTEEVTASDCIVACTTYTGPSEASATPECSTMCYSTHTGCSVTGTTSTTTTGACSATGAASCLTCRELLEGYEQPEDDESPVAERATVKIRNTKGLQVGKNDAVSTRRIEKRGNPEILKWEGCTFGKIPVIPAFIPGGALLQGQKDGTLTDAQLSIHKWLIFEKSGEPLCLRIISDVEEVPEYKLTLTGEDKFRATTDHAYEKKWLNAFLDEIVDPDVETVQGVSEGERIKINCDDFLYYIDDAPDSNLFEGITDQFPSDTQFTNDLIGMENWVNAEAKGTTAAPDQYKATLDRFEKKFKKVHKKTRWPVVQSKMDDRFALLQKLKLGVKIFNMPAVMDPIIRQNHRIWLKFKEIDANAISCKSDVAVTNHVWSFAAQYKNYMENLFNGDAAWSINRGVQHAKDFVLDQIEEDFPENSELSVPGATEQQELDQWRARVEDFRAANWEVSMSWDWSEIEARDESDNTGPACAISTSSPTLSTFYTSIVSETQTEESLTIQTTYEESVTSGIDENTSTMDYTTEQPTDEPTSSIEELPTTETEVPTSTTAEPEPEETTPLEQKPPSCNNENDFEGHAIIEQDRILRASHEFCLKVMEARIDKMYPGQRFDKLIVDTNYVRYQFSIEWVDGCHVSLDEESDWQYTQTPTLMDIMKLAQQTPECLNILTGVWKDCINGGVGGAVDVGCLRYRLDAGI